MSLLAGSGLVTVGALAMGVPLGVGTAVYLVEIASKRVRKLISLPLTCWPASLLSSMASLA